MPEQFIGAKAEFWRQAENIVGVPNFPLAATPLNTILSEPVQPGATSITVDSATNAEAGDIIRVGDDANPEYVKIASSYTTGTTIPLDSSTWINYQHAAGEPVQEVVPGGFIKLPSLVSVDAIGNFATIASNAIQSSRGQTPSRAGFVEVNFNLSFELGIESIGDLLVFAIGRNYTSSGAPVTGGGSTTVAAAASAGATSLQFTSLTNFAAGDYFSVGSGSTQEVSRISPTWNGIDNPVPLDPSLPLRYSHFVGETITEVTSPFVHTIVRGPIQSMTQILRFTETGQNDIIALIKGAKIGSASITLQPTNETIKVQLAVVAQSMQILESNIFGTPTVSPHKFYAPWEAMFIKDSVTSRIIEQLQWTIDNQIDGGGGKVLGLRTRSSVREGQGSLSGSITYQLRDAGMLKQLITGEPSSLTVRLTYAEDTQHALEFTFPAAKFSGQLMPGIPNDGPISDTKNFTAEIDPTTATDILAVVTTPEARLV